MKRLSETYRTREEFAEHLHVVLDQLKQCNGRLPEILRSGADIQALAMQASDCARKNATPTSKQLEAWAKALGLCCTVAVECSDRIFSCARWIEEALEELAANPGAPDS